MKKRKYLILALTLIIVIGLLTLLGYMNYLNNKIDPNPPGTVGNTPGNLYNKGLMCESDGIVYFSNPHDGGALYSMTPDEGNVTKLNKFNACQINAGAEHVYYYLDSDGAAAIAGFGGTMIGVYRSKKDGSKTLCLEKTPAAAVTLVDNYLYYQRYSNRNNEGMKLYKISTDKKDKVKVMDDYINPSCALNGTIFYCGINGDHALYALNTRNDNPGKFMDGSIYNPIVMPDGNTMYYMNVEDDYSIHKMNLSTREDEKLTEDRVDCFNITDRYIFYQKNDTVEPALMRINTDGSEPQLIMNGNFTNINVTSAYVYFQPYGDNSKMYHCPVNGAVLVSDFTPVAENE